MSATTAQDFGAMHPMSTESKTTPAPVPKKKITRGIPLYTVSETEQHREAIDSAVDPCSTSGRPTMKVNTPNGIKEAIVMTDGPLTSTCGAFILRASRAVREFCNTWSNPHKYETYPSTYTPEMSLRSSFLAQLFQFYTCHAVIRLISKPPLFQSQRFWVSWDSAEATDDSIGFDWNPSEQNEVYCVVPWFSNDHMLTTDNLPNLACGKLTIRAVTDLVTEEGLPNNLQVSVMCAPVDLDLFLPQDPPSKKTLVEAEEQCINSISALYEHSQKNRKTAPDFWIFSDIERPGTFKCVCTYDGIMEEGFGRTKSIAKYGAADKVFAKLVDMIQNPKNHKGFCCSEYCFRIPSCQVDGIACPTCEAYSYCMCRCISYKKPILAEEQIFEYDYDSGSTQADADYGKSEDTSDRANHHWQRVQTKTVSDSKDVLLEFSMETLGMSTASLEAQRHLFLSKPPTFKLTATANPSSTALYRVTTSTKSATVTSLSCPGIEWDIKNGELVFEPYWQFNRSAVPTSNFEFDIKLQHLTGIVGTAYHLTLWVNTAPIQYHHMKHVEYVEEQANSTNESDMPSDVQGFIKDVEQAIERNSSDTADSAIGKGVAEGVAKISPSQNEVNQAEAIGVTQSERDWKLVGSFRYDPVDIAAIAFAITTQMFGRYNWYTARRYMKWKGAPRFKIQTTSASTTNAQVFYVHGDELISDPRDAEILPFMLPSAKASVNEAAVEMELKWRAKTPTLSTDFSTTGTNLGYLTICTPNYSAPLVDGANNEIQVAIYCDVSNIKYSHPSGRSLGTKWKFPQLHIVRRDGPTPPTFASGMAVKSTVSDENGRFTPAVATPDIIGVGGITHSEYVFMDMSENPAFTLGSVGGRLLRVLENKGIVLKVYEDVSGDLKPKSGITLYYVESTEDGAAAPIFSEGDISMYPSKSGYVALQPIGYAPGPYFLS